MVHKARIGAGRRWMICLCVCCCFCCVCKVWHLVNWLWMLHSRGAAGRTRLTMIKLFSVKQKQREAAESANGRAPIKKQSAGELRLQKGLSFSYSFSCFQFLLTIKRCVPSLCFGSNYRMLKPSATQLMLYISGFLWRTCFVKVLKLLAGSEFRKSKRLAF